MQRSLSTFLSPRVGSGIDKASAGKTVLRNYAQGLLKAKLLRKKHGANVVHDFVCDLSASPTRFNMMDGCCPCATKSRASTSSFYSISRKRYLDNDDFLALQGVPKSRLVVPPHLSSAQFGGMVGNAMDVRLLARILSRLLKVLPPKVQASGSDGAGEPKGGRPCGPGTAPKRKADHGPQQGRTQRQHRTSTETTGMS